MEILFVPEVCKPARDIVKGEAVDVPAEFEGHLKVDLPSFPDRLKLRQKISDEAGGAGTDQGKAQSKAYDMLAIAFEKGVALVREVKISKRLKGEGEPCSAVCGSVEELRNNPEFDAVAMDFAGWVLRGFKPSEKK